MKLEKLPKITTKKEKRIGRGQSSGKGKTAGRGTKGQNSRHRLSITHPHFEGGQRSLIKRLPYKRGKGNSKISKKPIVVNIEALNIIAQKQTVDLDSLIKYGIVVEKDAKTYGVKILGDGSLKKQLTVNLPTSKSAANKIQKAGGKVTYQKNSK